MRKPLVTKAPLVCFINRRGFLRAKKETNMEWQKTSIKIMNLSEEILAVITPIQWVLFAASLAFVILTFIKDKRSRWLAASFGVISFGLFVNMYIYCNSFDCAFYANRRSHKFIFYANPRSRAFDFQQNAHFQ